MAAKFIEVNNQLQTLSLNRDRYRIVGVLICPALALSKLLNGGPC